MKRTKVFYNALILLATLLLTACQDQKDIPEVSSPEKNLVLSDHISNQKVKHLRRQIRTNLDRYLPWYQQV